MNKNDFQNEVLIAQPVLSRYAYRLTQDTNDAEDLLQDTYFRAFSNQGKYSRKFNLKPWLFTIMKNIFINNYKKKKTEHAYFSTKNYPKHTTVSSENPYHQMLFNELNICIEGLQMEFRTPLEMHSQGFQYKEIAEKMNIPIGTVKSRLYFARAKLSNILNP